MKGADGVERCECYCSCSAVLTPVELKYYEEHPEERQKLCGRCYNEMRGTGVSYDTDYDTDC